PHPFYTLSLHDALPISAANRRRAGGLCHSHARRMLPRSREDHLRQRPPRTQNSRPRDRRDPTSLDGGAELFRLAPIHIGLLEIRDRKSTRLNSSHVAIS